MKSRPVWAVLLFLLVFSCGIKENSHDPQNEILDWGRNPGLRIQYLHEQGITGKGVHIALAGSSVYPSHQEYRDKCVFHTVIPDTDLESEPEGTACASILIGKTCGIAPDAVLHVWDKREGQQKILSEIIEYNREQFPEDRIRVAVFPNCTPEKKLKSGAEKEGIFVLCCSDAVYGVQCDVLGDKESYLSYTLQNNDPQNKKRAFGAVLVPCGNKTAACCSGPSEYEFRDIESRETELAFYGGVLALGFQAGPDLTPRELRDIVHFTGIPLYGGRIINPLGIIEEIRGSDKTSI